MSPDLVLALRLADAADAVSTAPFRSEGLLVEIKVAERTRPATHDEPRRDPDWKR